jgi:hypothetical protein
MADRSEKAIQNDTLVELTREFHPTGMFWRNNTGMAWAGEKMRVGVGQMVRIEPGMTVLRNARPLTAGVPGSPDILGADRGRPVGIEVKDAKGQQREAQVKFERAWVKAGGLYILARSPEEAIQGLRRGV